MHISVDLETLTRLANHPGDLAGYGPVIADLARQVTDQNRNGVWEFVVTDPDYRPAGRRGDHPTATHRPTTKNHPSAQPPLCHGRLPGTGHSF